MLQQRLIVAGTYAPVDLGVHSKRGMEVEASMSLGCSQEQADWQW